MAFAAGEQGRHAALLHALCHREKQAVVSTALLQTRVSEAALGCARLHARVATCLHGVSRPYSCCQANVGRFWRRSLRSSGQRASCHVHRTLLHRRNVIMCSVRGRWPPQAGRVKIIDFSKTTLLSCSQRADHGTLRGSASFALVHEKVWSKKLTGFLTWGIPVYFSDRYDLRYLLVIPQANDTDEPLTKPVAHCDS